MLPCPPSLLPGLVSNKPVNAPNLLLRQKGAGVSTGKMEMRRQNLEAVRSCWLLAVRGALSFSAKVSSGSKVSLLHLPLFSPSSNPVATGHTFCSVPRPPSRHFHSFAESSHPWGVF